MCIRLIFVLFVLLVVVWGLPRPPPESDDKPTIFNPDGTPATTDSSSNFNQKDKDRRIKWKGPAEKYFHESTVRLRNTPHTLGLLSSVPLYVQLP